MDADMQIPVSRSTKSYPVGNLTLLPCFGANEELMAIWVDADTSHLKCKKPRSLKLYGAVCFGKLNRKQLKAYR